ncbi:hypothetical protein EJ03DRAFT_140513 [Teratosphaeria nubilosa]|uniref:Uncharacterized protein n=1 Tax=Teratosphaeria nubilosa TaxID=161662 RepID=A0A6G1L4Q5_9PEZI|nr:hypothetical protein EJ03DRAFT_140513 [Teratosphaeria nubilosa]
MVGPAIICATIASLCKPPMAASFPTLHPFTARPVQYTRDHATSKQATTATCLKNPARATRDQPIRLVALPLGAHEATVGSTLSAPGDTAVQGRTYIHIPLLRSAKLQRA